MAPVYSQNAGRYDLVVDTNALFDKTFQLCTNAAGTTFFNLTGYTPKAEIRDRKGGTLLATMTCSVVSAVNGQIRCQIARATTSALVFSGKAYWDLIITAGTTTYRVIEGAVELSGGVTTP